MLTNEEISSIVKAVIKARLELFPTKKDFKDLRADLKRLKDQIETVSSKLGVERNP